MRIENCLPVCMAFIRCKTFAFSGKTGCFNLTTRRSSRRAAVSSRMLVRIVSSLSCRSCFSSSTCFDSFSFSVGSCCSFVTFSLLFCRSRFPSLLLSCRAATSRRSTSVVLAVSFNRAVRVCSALEVACCFFSKLPTLFLVEVRGFAEGFGVPVCLATARCCLIRETMAVCRRVD